MQKKMESPVRITPVFNRHKSEKLYSQLCFLFIRKILLEIIFVAA